MVSISFDSITARELMDAAGARGMTVQDFVREQLLLQTTPHMKLEFSAAKFDEQLDGLLLNGPSLPEDFSRADIYSDHD